MKTHSPLSLLPLLLLAGCASIDQAALIYSSRITGGLDLSASGTESQGVALNIGFKTVDFAYVPVAVAASAPGGRVTPLHATHNESAASAARRVQAEEDALRRVQKAAEKEVDARTQSLKALKANLKSKATEAEQEKVDRAERNLEAAQGALALANDAMNVPDPSRLTMKDAMSVYGSFNGRGEGAVGRDNPNGALTMGRVFSTGVAAQKLTRAALIEANSSCLQRYTNLVDRAPPASQPELAAAVGKVCKSVED